MAYFQKNATKSLLWRWLGNHFYNMRSKNAALVSDEALIITNKSYYHMTEKLVEISRQSPKIKYLLEPMGRNTAPAIALAVREIQAVYGDNVLCLVLAADHLISGNIAFQKSIKKPPIMHNKVIW